jgi:hypothetical protein
MPVEIAVVVFDGAFTADRELNNLRVSRLDPWVGEVAVLERHHGGLSVTRATSPDGPSRRAFPRPDHPCLDANLSARPTPLGAASADERPSS